MDGNILALVPGLLYNWQGGKPFHLSMDILARTGGRFSAADQACHQPPPCAIGRRP
jgi:hypothetical protein